MGETVWSEPARQQLFFVRRHGTGMKKVSDGIENTYTIFREARPERARVGRGLAGVAEVALRDRVRGRVEVELDLVADRGGQGVGREGQAALTDGDRVHAGGG